MQDIFKLYTDFLTAFPPNLRPFISLGLVALIIYSIVQVIKKDFVYLIALVVLLPGSVPILRSIWNGALSIIHFLLNSK